MWTLASCQCGQKCTHSAKPEVEPSLIGCLHYKIVSGASSFMTYFWIWFECLHRTPCWNLISIVRD
jgi:hypothetical protein